MGSARDDVVVTEFAGPEVGKLYVKVNALLGWDGIPGSDAAPAGLSSSITGESGDALVVIEVWESKAQQATLMDSKLGPRLLN
jgi:hypothetical protein